MLPIRDILLILYQLRGVNMYVRTYIDWRIDMMIRRSGFRNLLYIYSKQNSLWWKSRVRDYFSNIRYRAPHHFFVPRPTEPRSATPPDPESVPVSVSLDLAGSELSVCFFLVEVGEYVYKYVRTYVCFCPRFRFGSQENCSKLC